MKESMANETVEASRLAVHGAALAGDGAPPEWIALLPAGVFNGRDGRGPYRLADPAGVIAATQGLGMRAGIPIDYDHATDLAAPEGRPAPAAGWIRELAAREGAIWGRVEWTPHGAAAVTSHEYRYISPVFEHGRDGEVVRLLRAALTNNPNLYLTAICSSTAQPSESGDEDASAAAMRELATELCAMLGLEETSTPDEIVEAVRAIAIGRTAEVAAHSSGADPARFVPVAHFQQTVSELNALRAARARERAEHTVAEAMRAGKLVPAQREWAIAYGVADFEGLENFVARQPAIALGESQLAGAPRGSEPGAREALAGGNPAMNRAELEVCTILGVAAEDFLMRKGAQSGRAGTIAGRDRSDFFGAVKH